jgi:hypothetical protein
MVAGCGVFGSHESRTVVVVSNRRAGMNDADIDLDALAVSLSRAIGGHEETAGDLPAELVAQLRARHVVLPAAAVADLDERVKAAVYGAVETGGDLQQTVVPRFIPRSMLNANALLAALEQIVTRQFQGRDTDT